MKNRRFITRLVVLLGITLALGYTFYTSFVNQKDIVSVGDLAPNFVLTDLEGREVELAELKGKGVFLNFWATVCPPCRDEMPYMENSYQQYKDQGIVVLAVNFDEAPLAIDRFVQRYGLSFPILLDKGLQVSQVYGVRELPATFLIDENGVVIERRIGGMTEQMVENYVQKLLPTPQ
jgi:peroxiredoxin